MHAWAFVKGIHRWLVDPSHKWPVVLKAFPCHDVVTWRTWRRNIMPLQWRHNGRDGVSNRKPHDCLLNRLFRRRSKKTPKLHVTGLCAGNSPVTGKFPAQRASDAENISIWWRLRVLLTRWHIFGVSFNVSLRLSLTEELRLHEVIDFEH